MEIYNEDTRFREEPVTYEAVHEHLKSCFGDHLKTFSFVEVDETYESTEGVPDEVVNRCTASRIERLLSQFHAIYRTGQQIQKYMLQNSVQYDYILRFRPDILVKEAPNLQTVDNGKVINIRATYDLTYWGLHHDGSMHTGFTDIAAYGRASAMWTYFNIYTGLKSMLSSEPIWDWSDIIEIDRNRSDLGDQNRCNPEGMLGYWLTLNGLELETDWRWKIGILRRDGHLSQGFFTCQPWLKSNWMCPDETIW
ncbi:hypothetical protein PVAG01_08491 [Phlyctema vagabunda]|uniref:Uncharacterized protein n=1 Tax=Phlyctema vagabunda TaxID=108571 RepID=A0ABR4P9Y6_9HELO